MPWGFRKDDEVPESLKGRSPEEVAKALDDAKALADRLKALEDAQAAKDGELTAAQSEVEAMRQQLQQINANREAEAQKTPQQPSQVVSVLDNEDAAFQQRLAPIQVAMFQNLANTARLQAREAIRNGDPLEAELFNRYEAEVESIFKTVPLQNQVHIGSYLNCFAITKGRHIKELKDIWQKEGGQHGTFSEGVSTGGSQPQKDDTKPSAADVTAAKKFGLDPQKYFEARKRLNLPAA